MNPRGKDPVDDLGEFKGTVYANTAAQSMTYTQEAKARVSRIPDDSHLLVFTDGSHCRNERGERIAGYWTAHVLVWRRRAQGNEYDGRKITIAIFTSSRGLPSTSETMATVDGGHILQHETQLMVRYGAGRIATTIFPDSKSNIDIISGHGCIRKIRLRCADSWARFSVSLESLKRRPVLRSSTKFAFCHRT